MLFHTIGCRAAQCVDAACLLFRPVGRQTVREGGDAVLDAAVLLRGCRARKPLIVAEAGLSGWREKLLRTFDEAGLPYALWERVDGTPDADDVENIRLFWLGNRCDSFVAVGGPCAMDAAKLAAARAVRPGRTAERFAGRNRVGRRLPPVLALPMRPGSGAESCCVAVLRGPGGALLRADDRRLSPRLVALDPALIEDATRGELAEGGMDALCLAAEAFLARGGGSKYPALALEAVGQLFSALEGCCENGGTPAERLAILSASRKAGLAASRCGGGYARALVHALEDELGVSAGQAAAAALPAVLELYRSKKAAAKLAALNDAALNWPEPPAQPPAPAEHDLVWQLRSLACRLGLPDRFPSVTDEMAERVIARALAEANPHSACPAVFGRKELEKAVNTLRGNG